MRLYTQNGIMVAEVPVKDFKIRMVNQRKKNIGKKNYCSGGFFQTFSEGGSWFTLPVGHLVADMDSTDQWVNHYCKNRGTVENGKVTFDAGSWNYQNQFFDKTVSTLTVVGGKARIDELKHPLSGSAYAIAGVPIMRNGADVGYASFVRPQGWLGSELYGTWHVFLGIKREDTYTVYVIGMKTTSGNMVLSSEAFKKFKSLGLSDVIKLDGGGSYYFNADGTVSSTVENRLINTIITFGDSVEKTDQVSGDNPYKQPTVALRRGSTNKEGVKWLQWELCRHGYRLDIDGSFGAITDAAVRAFQKSNGLSVDGSVGLATRAALLK